MKTADWEKRLLAYIQTEMGQPFAWRVRDCNTFAVACLNAMLHHPLLLPALNYDDERSARRFAKQHSLRGIMRHQLNAYTVACGFQARGDIALVKQGGFECAHVVLGRYCVFPHPQAGVSLGRIADLPLEAEFVRFD